MTSTPFELDEPRGGARFVILHHTGWGRDHWDLMLEGPRALATWQLYHDPSQLGEKPLELFRIAGHRKHYLDYEGPVSRGRGTVRRVARGRLQVLQCDPHRWRVRLETPGGPLVLELRRIDQARWIVEKAV